VDWKDTSIQAEIPQFEQAEQECLPSISAQDYG
jgi:hypothetical protein